MFEIFLWSEKPLTLSLNQKRCRKKKSKKQIQFKNVSTKLFAIYFIQISIPFIE